MSTRKGRSKFNNFRILLDIVCSSTILMISIVDNLIHKKDDVMQWPTQAGNITTNQKNKIYITLTELSATE